MSNQSVRLTNASIVAALNNKADIELENSSKAAAIESLANSAATTANAASKVADAAVDLIEVQMPLKVNKSGDTFNGNVVIDGNLTVTGDVNIPADGISGSVEVATSATKDSNGNVIVDTYLRKDGDTVTGTIIQAGPALSLAKDSNTSINIISGGTTNTDGACLTLRGVNYTALNPGGWMLAARTENNTQESMLVGKSNGELTLDGKNVAIVISWVSGSNWYRIWNDGIIEQGGSILATGDSTNTVTLHTKMSTSSYTISATHYGTSLTDAHPVKVGNRTTTSFTITNTQDSNITYGWIIIGK